MGFFSNVGRQVEQFKQTVQEVADESAEYRCESCDTALQTDHEHCPECGAESVVPASSAPSNSEK